MCSHHVQSCGLILRLIRNLNQCDRACASTVQAGDWSTAGHSQYGSLGHWARLSVREPPTMRALAAVGSRARISSWSHLIRGAELALRSAVQADAVPADRLVLPELAHGQRMPPARVHRVGPREFLAVRKLEVDAKGELVGEP